MSEVCERCGETPAPPGLLWQINRVGPRYCDPCLTAMGHAPQVAPSEADIAAPTEPVMLPTWSSLERGYHCPTSFALPQAKATTIATKVGHKNHAAKEAAVDDGDLANIPETARDFIRESGADYHETEVAYAIDVRNRKVRRIGTKIERNYGKLGPWEIAGTIDLVSGPRVLDYKSRMRVTEAKDNFQIRAAALSRAEELGATEIKGALSYLDNGELDEATFDAFELVTLWDVFEDIAVRIAAAKPDDPVHEGDWCKHCPAFASCRAKTALARAMVPELETIEAMVATLTPSEAGAAWAKLKSIKQISERVEDALKTMAGHQPLPMPNGKRLTIVREQQTRVDLKKARERFGDDLPTYTITIEKTKEEKGAA